MLYSKNGSYPTRLPHRIMLSDGTTRTDNTSFTEEEIADAGYVLVDNPPQADYPNKLDWDGSDWIIREPNPSETSQRWDYIRKECVRKLEETDYKVIKAVETGDLPPIEFVIYRQELRDLYNNVNNIDPWFVQFPVLLTVDEEIIQES
jgi:hypothetical protein